jgi:CspA family cold shock protein
MLARMNISAQDSGVSFAPRDAQSARGLVRWFDDSKGYGFIRPLDHGGGSDIFVHHSNIESQGYRTLLQGDVVQFDPVMTRKGFQASKVRLIAS